MGFNYLDSPTLGVEWNAITSTTTCDEFLSATDVNKIKEIESASKILGEKISGDFGKCELEVFGNCEEERRMSILEIWTTRETDKVHSAYEKKRNDIKAADSIYQLTSKYIRDVEEIIKDEYFHRLIEELEDNIESRLSENTKNKLFDLDLAETKEIDKIHQLEEEINAQLEMAETYDQKVAILKKYDVLDDKGIIKK